MSTPDFSTAENNQELANEVSCLKAMLTLMLQAMGQADAGRVMLKMQKQLALIEQRGFAGTTRTDNSHYFARLHLKVDTMQHRLTVEFFHQVLNFNGTHLGSLSWRLS